MGPVVTQNELARALGIAKSTLSGLIKREDWPVGWRGPWPESDVARVEKWRAWLQEDRSGKGREAGSATTQAAGGQAVGGSFDGATQKQKAETLLKLHKSRSAKVDADIAEGKVIERDAADLAVLNFAGIVRHRLDAMRDTLLQELPGDMKVIEPVIRRRFTQTLDDILADAEQGMDRMDDRVRERFEARKKRRA